MYILFGRGRLVGEMLGCHKSLKAETHINEETEPTELTSELCLYPVMYV